MSVSYFFLFPPRLAPFQYEDALFKCEDERYELDMVIENNGSALRWLESVKARLDELPDHEARLRFRLTPAAHPMNVLHLRAIARVYGDHANELVDLLKVSPYITIPVIVGRMFQKDNEWRKVRTDMKRAWRDVCEKNFNKSLDHRSFYFKQEDRKKMAPKALVAELRELHERVAANPFANAPLAPLAGAEAATSTAAASSSSSSSSSSTAVSVARPTDVHAMRFRMPDDALHQEVCSTFILLVLVVRPLVSLLLVFRHCPPPCPSHRRCGASFAQSPSPNSHSPISCCSSSFGSPL